MDLGLTGRRAIVCASSHGLGFACAAALARAGCEVVINSRNPEDLDRAARNLADETGTAVRSVAADLDTDAGIETLLAAEPAADILVANNGGPPLRDFRTLTSASIHAGLQSNMVTPIRLVQGVIDGMVQRRFGRIVCITSATVKAPIAGLDLSSGARAGLTGFLAGVARSVAGANVTINFLLPGYFDTRRIRAVYEARTPEGGDVADARRALEAQIPAGRLGRPEELGATCAFLCSAHAGYMTGTNVLMDGGAYPGIL